MCSVLYYINRIIIHVLNLTITPTFIEVKTETCDKRSDDTYFKHWIINRHALKRSPTHPTNRKHVGDTLRTFKLFIRHVK